MLDVKNGQQRVGSIGHTDKPWHLQLHTCVQIDYYFVFTVEFCNSDLLSDVTRTEHAFPCIEWISVNKINRSNLWKYSVKLTTSSNNVSHNYIRATPFKKLVLYMEACWRVSNSYYNGKSSIYSICLQEKFRLSNLMPLSMWVIQLLSPRRSSTCGVRKPSLFTDDFLATFLHLRTSATVIHKVCPEKN